VTALKFSKESTSILITGPQNISDASEKSFLANGFTPEHVHAKIDEPVSSQIILVINVLIPINANSRIGALSYLHLINM
jgi:hypothetical protein